jgi:hypothetical protein
MAQLANHRQTGIRNATEFAGLRPIPRLEAFGIDSSRPVFGPITASGAKLVSQLPMGET